jgi:hypothetical protein
MAGLLQVDDVLAGTVYDDDPVLLLFGSDTARFRRARQAAARAGCRLAGEATLVEAAARLDRQVYADLVLLVAEEDSPALPALLARLEAAAASGLRVVISAAPEMIDAVAGAGLQGHVDCLVDPGEEELAVALALAAAPAPSRLHDVSRPRGAAMLQQLSEEAARLAHMLATLSEEPGAVPLTASPEDADAGIVDAAFVRSIIRARRLRDQYLRGGLFADPAWDMLLDLMAARQEGQRVAVSSLCIAAAVPATTALRWIKALTDQGLFVRSADPQDGRRVYIELSDQAAAAMGAYLATIQRSGLPTAI